SSFMRGLRRVLAFRRLLQVGLVIGELKRGKLQAFRLCFAVFVRQVGVAFAKQDTAIPMAKPTRDSQKIDPAHHGAAGEKATQIVEAKVRQASSPTGHEQGFAKSAGGSVTFTTLRRRKEPDTIGCLSRRHSGKKIVQ